MNACLKAGRTLRRAARLNQPVLAALSLAVLGSGTALAQTNVQLYGIVDAGVLTQSRSPGNGGSVTQLATSGKTASFWGIKGSESLGDGNSAFFNLEGQIDVDTGSLHGTGDVPDRGTPMFRRKTNLGISGDWGSFTIGRQLGPALLAHIGTEPRGFREQFSNLYAWAYTQYAATASGPGLPNRSSNNDVGIFFSNALQYRHTLGPVSFGVLYSLGEVAGSTSKNSVWALGAAYNGPVTVSGSYQEMKDAGSGVAVVKHSGLGIAVPFADGAFKANYASAKNYNGATGAEVSKVDAWGIGVDYKWHPANTFNVAYYDNKDKLNRQDATRNWVFSNDYSLSKRTTLYAQLALVDARSQASIKTSIVAAGIPAQGAKTTLLNIGLNHAF
jgi:predicted porin